MNAKGDYCTDSEWLGLLDGCLDCALKYDIWQDYGDKVSAAAEACGLDATPKPADGDSTTTAAGSGSSTASAPDAASTTEAVVSTTAADSGSGSTTAVVSSESAVESASSASEAVSSASEAAPTTVASVTSAEVSTAPTGGNGVSDNHCLDQQSTGANLYQTTTASPTSVTVSAGSQSWSPMVLVGGAAVMLASILM